MNRIGGRKVFFSIVVLAAGVAIDLSTERGLSQNLMVLMLSVLGMYATSNVVTKKISGNSAPQASVDNYVESQERLNEHEQYLSGIMTSVESLQKQVAASNQRVNALLTKGE